MKSHDEYYKKSLELHEKMKGKIEMKSKVPLNSKDDLSEVIRNADVFIGVSTPGILTPDDIRRMNKQPIIFAMTNPEPEIMPEDAMNAGAFIVATGRSDYPNQINNVLAFPGLMRGALDVRAKSVNYEMKTAAAEALASMVIKPSREKIIPSPFQEGIAKAVAEAVRKAAIETNVNKI